ncbi:MAG: N-acyl homoserine lactonase family protein [Thermoprotei archaeon]|mgnify:CR=1 FL=1|nr:N-acyl homoserine lactonase family protein [Thermoprotei archaeon]
MNEYRIRPVPLTKVKIDKSVMTYLMNFGKIIEIGTYLWVIEGGKEKIIVDTGCSAEVQRKGGFLAEQIMGLDEGLRSVGLRPEDVDIVILTHLHWDHCAYAKRFVNARFIVQKKELNAALSPHPAIKNVYNKEFIEGLNLETVDGEAEITDGVSVFLTPGHTPGGQSVSVETSKGRAVITGFCCIRENFEPPPELRDMFEVIMPGIHIDMLKLYDSMMEIKKRADFIIPLHDIQYLHEKEIP